MLQQTTVPTVIAYYEKFLKKWPRVQDLASAPQDDVLREWAGLGYYARARNLHACAVRVATDYKGRFPDTVDGLLDLPGIGPYTASAVAAMAFGVGVVPVDGNIERVVARLYEIKTPVRQAKPEIKQRAQALYDAQPDVFPGDLAQGLMDLGATVCTPRSPKCPVCPIRQFCGAYKAGNPADYPVPEPKKAKPVRFGHVYLIHNKRGQYLLLRRPPKGLLGGMVAFPTTEWLEKAPKGGFLPPITVKNPEIRGEVRHSFTHFDLVLQVVHGQLSGADQKEGLWYESDGLYAAGLPKVFLKALAFMMDKEKVQD